VQVEVKGWRYGLLIIVPPTGGWSEIIERVHEKLDEAKARSFWRGSQTTFDCGERVLTSEELQALVDRTRKGFGLIPVAIVSSLEETRQIAQSLSLEAYDVLPTYKKSPRETPSDTDTLTESASSLSAESPSTSSPSPQTVASTYAPNNALYLVGTVRSGQRLLHDSHLIICGDVNAGGEVIAGGDIVVVGTLRGLAHAGCFGDEKARITAGNLRPHQLRIAGKIARAPEDAPASASGSGRPEMARIEGGEIGVFPL
jgi:septum site-determining protein MinC